MTQQILDKPIILHNVISEQYQIEIEDRFLGSGITPWFFTNETTQENNVVETTSVMYHMLYGWGTTHSPVFDFVKPLMWEVIKQAGLPFREFLQVRAITQFPVPTSRTHNMIHTDLPERQEPYVTGVYYVNGDGTDIDGDTVVFNQTTDDVSNWRVVEKYKTFTEQIRSTPLRGKVILFPGCMYHASTLPTRKTRTVLNFAFA